MGNQEFEKAKENLRVLIRAERIPWRLDLLKKTLDALDRGIRISERDIENALNGALRGSEFPGDMVGRPADDFTDYYGDDYVYRKEEDDAAEES